jgi:hypothetical protein
MTLIRIFVMLSFALAASACSQCTTTDCGGGRSATWCLKQGKDCAQCKNHKLTDESGKTLYACEDSFSNGKLTSCDEFIKRDIADYCAKGAVCVGLTGACSADSQCCSGSCGSVTKQCVAP